MSLEKKLKKWIESDLITSEQMSAILNFEKKDSNKNFWKTSYIFAGILIGFGLCLVVASNWDEIPSFFKFVFDFSISGYFVWNACKNIEIKKKGLVELFLILSFLMIGTTIGLTGQVFHLEGGWVSFAFFWAILGIPFVFYSRSIFLNFSWLILFCHIFATNWMIKILRNFGEWIGQIHFFHKEVFFPVLFMIVFYGLSFLFKRLDEKVNKLTILPYYLSKLFLFVAYYLLIGIGILGLGFEKSWLHSVLTEGLAIFFFFAALVYRLWFAVKTKDMLIFKHNTSLAELYIFALFASRMRNLFSSGLGFIFCGLFILFIIYALKKTNGYIKNMEVFK